ncbi:hypothetical protein BKA61DRAFT_484663 [Leptodontidium sp. MPI-SDFR-AT-0119]|nr:hypothetical protein BKA61DRAFT_484663 [Leptodontidium sp. MPI-SDFR-AT-0119]
MALAYAEGECFFNRKGLVTKDGYQATKPKDFYSHFMNMPFSYGPKNEIARRKEHKLCVNGNRFVQLERGGSAEAWFMTLPLPFKKEKWIWIDLLTYIRGIYIQVCHTANKDYPEISTWIQINFALDRTVRIWNGTDFVEITTHVTDGLGIRRDQTLGLNIYGIIQLLSLPRQLRKSNVYDAKLVMIVNKDEISKSVMNWVTSYGHDRITDFDYARIIKANCGLDPQWKPAGKSTWLLDFIKNTIGAFLDFVPIIGPLLQTAFAVGRALVLDPDSAFDILKEMAPGVDLADRIIKDIKGSAEETREYLPDRWDKIKFVPPPKAIRDVTAKVSPTTANSDESDDPVDGDEEFTESELRSLEQDAEPEGDEIEVDDTEYVEEDYEEMETSPSFAIAASMLAGTGTRHVGEKDDLEGTTVLKANKATEIAA